MAHYGPMFALLLVSSFLAEQTGLWSRFYELDHRCEHEPAHNTSGVKVLVVGLAKTATKSLSRALYQIGLNHSYHSEDLGFFVTGPLSDTHWLRQNGGYWRKIPLPAFLPILNFRDREVIRRTSPAELAAAISRCRVDAIAFDGIEELFPHVHEVSPGAKVILMRWRTYFEWRVSFAKFALSYILLQGPVVALYSSLHLLPWNALIVHLMETFAGQPVAKVLKQGGPPILEVMDLPTMFFEAAVHHRRVVSRWFSGHVKIPLSEKGYEEHFRELKARIAPEDLLELDPRKNTYEDLCAFLQLPSCPRSGRIDKAVNLLHLEHDFPRLTALKVLVCLLFHWVNWQILKKATKLAGRARSWWLHAGGLKGARWWTSFAGI